MSTSQATPTEMIVHQQSKVLEVHFDTQEIFRIPFELMRVYSPSAEVRGHGAGQEILQTGKRSVVITAIEPVGHYGIKPTFSDGHDSGIFAWDYLYQLGTQQERLWQEYAQRLLQAGKDRDDPMTQPGASSCGHAH
jgi:DUF971 family protein